MRNYQVQMKHGRSKHKDQILRQSKQLVQWGTGFGRRKRTKESWHEYKVEDSMTEQSSHTAKQKDLVLVDSDVAQPATRWK